MSRIEYLYKFIATKKKRDLLMEFVYGQVLSIEKHAEAIVKINKGQEDSRSQEALGDAEEILLLCESIRAYSEVM